MLYIPSIKYPSNQIISDLDKSHLEKIEWIEIEILKMQRIHSPLPKYTEYILLFTEANNDLTFSKESLVKNQSELICFIQINKKNISIKHW